MSFSMRCESTKTAFFLTETEGSFNLEYIFSVHGSNKLGNRTAKSPRQIVQLERTISDGALSTTVKSSWRFVSLEIIRQMSDIMYDCSKKTGMHIHSQVHRPIHKNKHIQRERERERSYQKFASIIMNRHKASIADT